MGASCEYPEGSDHARRAEELREQHRTGLKARWARALRRPSKALGLDADLMLQHLERQDFKCPLCTKEFEVPHIDLDDEGSPRGILCGYCFRFLKAVEGDPLHAKAVKYKHRRKAIARVLVYLGIVEPATS